MELELVKPGETVHVIERRLFSGDVRRHFAGEIRYTHDTEGNLTLTDDASFDLDTSEFRTKE
jgi:hypothetical protein